MKILELGSYIAPAYAGMILAEQNHFVEKWIADHDPIQSLNHGEALWNWINQGKTLVKRHPISLSEIKPGNFDLILDNFRASTLTRWGIDPAWEADRLNCPWVSLRSEVGEYSFDLVAQARSILSFCPWVPFYLGDTTAGLWMAFKGLTASPGHHVLGQASCLQKLVEGELILQVERNSREIPWDTEDYFFDGREAVVTHKGTCYREPVRDHDWKLKHLWHQQGRIVI
jgi:hypothetical protein